MRSVIKHAEQDGPFRRFAPEAQAFRSAAVVDPAVEQRAALERQVDQLSRSLDESRRKAASAVEHARGEGYEAGLAAAADRQSERLAVLRAGVSSGLEAADRRLSEIEVLAAALARAALAKIFDRPDAMAEMVTAALARYASGLKQERVTTVRVSAADFPDPGALVELRGALRDERATISIDRELPPGACRVAHALGQVDLDVPGQWSALEVLLERMAQVA